MGVRLTIKQGSKMPCNIFIRLNVFVFIDYNKEPLIIYYGHSYAHLQVTREVLLSTVNGA